MELNPLGLPDILDVSRWDLEEERLYYDEEELDRHERRLEHKAQKLDREEQRSERKRESLNDEKSYMHIRRDDLRNRQYKLEEKKTIDRLRSFFNDAISLNQARETLWNTLMSAEPGAKHMVEYVTKRRYWESDSATNDLLSQHEEVLRMDQEWSQNINSMFAISRWKSKYEKRKS
ncbi:MAG: hypothetical protein Q9218_007963, partial [Villophora microphyllina]